MGINDVNFYTLEGIFSQFPVKSVLELGAQNFYHNTPTVKYGCYADQYYKSKGVTQYTCIDVNAENGALDLDLSVPHSLGKFDLVTDFGTSEHINRYDNPEALYNCWTTKFNATNSVIVSSNPASGHWPGHGAYYYTLMFYQALASCTNLQIIKLGEQYAMGNYIDGKEITCVLLKTTESHWLSLEDFTSTVYQHIKPI